MHFFPLSLLFITAWQLQRTVREKKPSYLQEQKQHQHHQHHLGGFALQKQRDFQLKEPPHPNSIGQSGERDSEAT